MEALNRPDPAAIREALRGVRHVLRRVKASLRDMPAPYLPGPAGEIAGKAAREVGALTTEMDAAASKLARRVLGGGHAAAVQLPDNVGGADFASALYWALQGFFRRFGVPDQFVSEMVARAAYEKTLETRPQSGTLMAAELTCNLIADRVIRGATPVGTGDMAGEDVRAVAVFATLLWLQSERPDDEDEQALLAAQDVAVALRTDVARACSSGNREDLSKLYHDFASHI